MYPCADHPTLTDELDNSDHAGSVTTTGGPSWVAAIVNAIGKSPYWANTAILITWDDWGGWYDHVAPPKVVTDGTSWGSGYVYGFRVPLIVISRYAKAAYISHVNHDFGSILNLNLIEENLRPELAGVCRCLRGRSLGLLQLQPGSAGLYSNQRAHERGTFPEL